MFPIYIKISKTMSMSTPSEDFSKARVHEDTPSEEVEIKMERLQTPCKTPPSTTLTTNASAASRSFTDAVEDILPELLPFSIADSPSNDNEIDIVNRDDVGTFSQTGQVSETIETPAQSCQSREKLTISSSRSLIPLKVTGPRLDKPRVATS